MWQTELGKDAMGRSFMLKHDATVGDLKAAFHAKNKKFYPERQAFSIGQGRGKTKLRGDGSKLADFGVRGQTDVTFTDLGTQVSKRTVYLVSYIGPLLLHILPFYYSSLVYEFDKANTYVQTVAFLLVVSHYGRRLFETLFIYKLSTRGIMSVGALANQSVHFWLFGGFFLSYFLYHPLYTAKCTNPTTLNILAGLFVLTELGSLSSHITLAGLRRTGSEPHAMPRGSLFSFVSCPNDSWCVKHARITTTSLVSTCSKDTQSTWSDPTASKCVSMLTTSLGFSHDGETCISKRCLCRGFFTFPPHDRTNSGFLWLFVVARMASSCS